MYAISYIEINICCLIIMWVILLRHRRSLDKSLTANAFDEDRMKAYDAGMDAYVAKPIDINKLIYTLKEVLG